MPAPEKSYTVRIPGLAVAIHVLFGHGFARRLTSATPTTFVTTTTFRALVRPGNGDRS
jgi:hypothetical protein